MELHNPTLVVLLGGTALATLLALLAVLSRKGRTEDTARAYLAGFTYVLSDDPDAAIAELSKAAQLNTARGNWTAPFDCIGISCLGRAWRRR